MEIASSCLHCGRVYRGIPEEYSGRIMRCEGCGTQFPIVAGEANMEAVDGLNLLTVQSTGAKAGAGEESVPTEWSEGDLILGLYQVTKLLGVGGMGKVHKVRHLAWNMDLAVKSPKADILNIPGAKENFIIEAETWVNLGLHPNICSCYYVRELGRIPRLFAEFVSGGDLEGWIKPVEGELPRLYQGGPEKALERMLDIAIQFAWGLQYAHEQGMIHQDIKPANVMLTEKGVAKVTDFGLARHTVQGDGGDGTVAAAGMSPRWCSPEQANQQALSTKTDIWSWAVSILPMFTGAITWRRGTMAPLVLESFLDEGGKAEAEHIPAMPKGVVELLQHCLQQEPGARPGGMDEIAQRLQEIYRQEVGAAYPRPTPKSGKAMAGSLNNRAVSLVDLQRIDEAEQLWQEALERHPNHIESTFNRGLILWRLGKEPDDQRLIANLEECLQSHKEDWLASYLLGLAHMERGDCVAARKALLAAPTAELQRRELREALAAIRLIAKRARRSLGSFLGHEGQIRSVAIDAQGAVAITASEDKSLRVWDLNACRVLQVLTGHRAIVTAVRISANGQLAVSGSEDNTLRLWNLQFGTSLRTMTGHVKPVASVDLSRDGRVVLSGGSDNVLKVWEAESGRCLLTLQGHHAPVNSVSLSADARFALSGSGSAFAHDNTVRLWELRGGSCLAVLKGHAKPVLAVAYSTDGGFALSGDDAGTLCLWAIPSGEQLHKLEAHDARINGVAFANNGLYAISAAGSAFSKEHSVKLWDLQAGRCLRTFTGHQAAVQAVALSQDGLFALSGGEEKELRWWQTALNEYNWAAPMALSRVVDSQALFTAAAEYEAKLQQARAALQQDDALTTMALTRQARSLPGFERGEAAVALWGQLAVRLAKQGFRDGWEEGVWDGHNASITAITCRQDEQGVASGDSQGKVLFWNLATGQVEQTIKAHQGAITALGFNHDASRLLTGGEDNLLQFWDVGKGLSLRICHGHTLRVRAVALFRSGRHALSASADETIRLWDLATGQCKRLFKGHQGQVVTLALAPDETSLLSGGEDGTLRLWNVASGKMVAAFKGHDGQIFSVVWGGDGRTALSAGANGRLLAWDLVSRTPPRLLEGHQGTIHSVDLTSDARFALSAGADRSLRVWELANGTMVRLFAGLPEAAQAVCFAPSARFFLSGGTETLLHKWALDWDFAENARAEWDAGAQPWVSAYLARRAAGNMPGGRPFHRRWPVWGGSPPLTEPELAEVVTMLGHAGFGWLRSEGVRNHIDELRLGVVQRTVRTLKTLPMRWQSRPTKMRPPAAPNPETDTKEAS